MQRLTPERNQEFIEIEDFDVTTDTKFINDKLVPYFRDLFRDLALRCHQTSGGEKKIDKVTFTEYCLAPGIINDRLFIMFEDTPDNCITEKSFIDNFVKIFMSDVDTKMRLTFNM
jgi:hypothetical protein